MRTSECINKKLPIKSDEESSLVDKRFEISNLDLVKDLTQVIGQIICFNFQMLLNKDLK